jgi:DNA primase
LFDLPSADAKKSNDIGANEYYSRANSGGSSFKKFNARWQMKNRKIPRSYYEEVKNTIYWVDILSKLGIKFKRTGYLGGGNFKCLCIFHKEKTASLIFLRNSGRFHCFGCGESGDMFHFISRYLTGNKHSFPRVCRWLKKCFNIDLPW